MPTEDFTARCDQAGELGTGGALLRLRAHLRDQLHRQVWPPWFREWPSIEREAVSLRTWELARIRACSRPLMTREPSCEEYGPTTPTRKTNSR